MSNLIDCESEEFLGVPEVVCQTLFIVNGDYISCSNKPVVRLTSRYGVGEHDKEELILCEECHDRELAVCKKFSYIPIVEIIDPSFKPRKRRKYNKKEIIQNEIEESSDEFAEEIEIID
jgi:hypothetical protein